MDQKFLSLIGIQTGTLVAIVGVLVAALYRYAAGLQHTHSTITSRILLPRQQGYEQ
jgi:hypothetical protein